MKDRAMQALYLLALEPVSETTADSNSYGFRKEEKCWRCKRTMFCVLAKTASPEWILEGDIKGCFDISVMTGCWKIFQWIKSC